MRQPAIYKEYKVIADIPNTDVKQGRTIKLKYSAYQRFSDYLEPVEEKPTGKGSKK